MSFGVISMALICMVGIVFYESILKFAGERKKMSSLKQRVAESRKKVKELQDAIDKMRKIDNE